MTFVSLVLIQHVHSESTPTTTSLKSSGGRINVSPLSYMGVKKALESYRAVHTDDDVCLDKIWSEKFGS